MKRFQFRLEKVLQLKAHVERQCQQELAALFHRLNQAKERMKEINARRQACQQERNQLVRNGSSRLDLMMLEQYQRSLLNQAKQQALFIQAIQQQVSEKQRELRGAMKEKEKFQQYREQKWSEYRTALQKEEQDFLDEVAIRNFRYS